MTDMEFEEFKSLCLAGGKPSFAQFLNYCEGRGVDFEFVAVRENGDLVSLNRESDDPRRSIRVDLTTLPDVYRYLCDSRGVFIK